MEPKREDRFSKYTEVEEDGKIIGFKLEGNDFLFKYLSNGGWVDQRGIQYFPDGRERQREESESDNDQEDQLEDDLEDDLEDRDDDLVDEFEKILIEEQEGTYKNSNNKEKEAKQPKEEEDLNFKKLLERLQKKDELKPNLPKELFIYFKMRGKYYIQVYPETEKKQSTDQKNKYITTLRAQIEVQKKKLIEKLKWLQEQGVFLDYSGSSDENGLYDRYWYGVIKTIPQKYQYFLDQIENSQQFLLMDIKTYYALKSKFILKKNKEKVATEINRLRENIQAISENQTIQIKIDNLPQAFPLSYVIDLIEFTGGSLEDIEELQIIDDFRAQLRCLKKTALALVNIQGYNRDYKEYVIVQQVTNPRQKIVSKHTFYEIQVDNPYKLHERQLHDSMGLYLSKEQMAKHSTEQESKSIKTRFIIGSIDALRKVLMFRGPSLIPTRVSIKKPKPQK